MCGSSTPPPPDPYKTAAAQYQYNSQAARDAAELAAVDQSGPFGSTTFKRREDGTPYEQTVTLSPQVQQWLDSQFGSSTKLQDATSRQLDYLPTDRFQLPGDIDATGYARDAFGNAVLDTANFDPGKIAAASYEQAKSQFQPDIDAARKQKGIELAQRGINPGDEIYNDEMDRIDRQANQAYSGAARQAQLDAGNEQSRAMNNAIAARNYGNTTYQTNLSNQLLERNQPFSEAAALMGTTPNFQTPSFMNTQGVNIAAPDYQGQVANNYAQQVSAANSQNNALGSILGSVAGPLAKGAAGAIFSDERLKENISPTDDEDGERVLMLIQGMPISDWQYSDEAREGLGLPGGRHTGPMAQDFAEAFGGDGSTINLGDAVARLMQAVKALDKRTERAA
jgi:hypothetical protein